MRSERIPRPVKYGMVTTAALAAVVGLSAGPATAATGTVGGHQAKLVDCNTTINVPAPKILAVNATTKVDTQKVVFQPVLFRWDGSAWVFVKNGQVLEGTATDSTSPTTWFDYGLGYVVGQGTQSFTATRGQYKVAFRYWWLAANGSTSGSDYQWAPTYQTQIGAIASYCTY